MEMHLDVSELAVVFKCGNRVVGSFSRRMEIGPTHIKPT